MVCVMVCYLIFEVVTMVGVYRRPIGSVFNGLGLTKHLSQLEELNLPFRGGKFNLVGY